MFNIFVSLNIPSAAIEFLEESLKCNVKVNHLNRLLAAQELHASIANCDAVIVNPLMKVDADFLKAAGPKLKVCSTLSVGFDHMDMPLLKAAGIKVGYTPHTVSEATAETALSLMLMAGRRLLEVAMAARLGDWQFGNFQRFAGKSISNSIIGIVGCGRVGQALSKKLQSLAPSSVVYFQRKQLPADQERAIGATYVGFDELLKRSDFIVCCLPLTPETRHTFNESAFCTMKNSAVFVNISRGGLVNQDDLLLALQKRQIWAAGLDVTEPEPLPVGHPLYEQSNCVILPHVGSATEDSHLETAMLAVRNVIAGLSGKELPCELIV